MGKVLLSSTKEEILFRISLGGFGLILILNAFHPEILGLNSYIFMCVQSGSKKLATESVRQSTLTFPQVQCAHPSACLLLPSVPVQIQPQQQCRHLRDTGDHCAGTCPVLPALPQGM